MFAPAPEKSRPPVACIGQIESAQPVKETSSGSYYMINVKLKGLEGMGCYMNILYRPEWFTEGFSIVSLDPGEDASPEAKKAYNSIKFVYKKFAGSTQNPIGIVQGLCGTPARYAELIELAKSNDFTNPDVVNSVLVPFWSATPEIGYILKERTDKVEDASGKAQYVPNGKGFDVDSFFYADAKGRQQQVGRLARQGEDKFRVAFTY